MCLLLDTFGKVNQAWVEISFKLSVSRPADFLVQLSGPQISQWTRA